MPEVTSDDVRVLQQRAQQDVGAMGGVTAKPQRPSIGRIVIHRGIMSNGSMEHPAIITRVWTDVCVNLTVFVDHALPGVRTSQVHIDPENDAAVGWFWPPRMRGSSENLFPRGRAENDGGEMSEPTSEDVLAGVQCELESMRTNWRMHAEWCISAVASAAECTEDSKRAARYFAKAAYHAGAARLLEAFSHKGGHTENVWLGKVHHYERTKGEAK